MKKSTIQCSIFLPLFLASFFFIPKNAFASTFNYNISQTIVDQINNILPTMIDRVESYFTNNPGIRKKYFIEYDPNGNNQTRWRVYIVDTDQWINLFYTNNNLQYYTSGVKLCSITTSVTNCSTYSGGSYIKYIMYSTFRIPSTVSTNGTIVNYNFPDFTFSFTFSSTDFFYDLKTVYTDFSVPPDNTPMLTSFYSVAGSKVAWLGEQIVSNYIYLSIIGVFIIIFLIELIRRYFL